MVPAAIAVAEARACGNGTSLRLNGAAVSARGSRIRVCRGLKGIYSWKVGSIPLKSDPWQVVSMFSDL